VKLALPWLLAALVAGCRASAPSAEPAADLGLAPSLLPNVGLALSASLPLPGTREADSRWVWRAEARFTDQFVDDKSVADNGFPEAGNWTQLDLGLRLDERLDPQGEQRTRWSLRFGLVGFDARGEPNLVEEPGHYLGAYLGAGRSTRFANGLWLGPELTLIAASGEDPRVFIPQLTWGLRWSP